MAMQGLDGCRINIATVGAGTAQQALNDALAYVQQRQQFGKPIAAFQGLQCLGGYGYMKEYPMERYLRDSRVHRILEGTNDIMRVIIARRMLAADAQPIL